MEMELEMESSDYLNNHNQNQNTYPWMLERDPSKDASSTSPPSNSFYLNSSRDQLNDSYSSKNAIQSIHPTLLANQSASGSSNSFNPSSTSHSSSKPSSPFLSDHHSAHFHPLPSHFHQSVDEDDDSGSGGMIRPNNTRRSLIDGLDRDRDPKRRRLDDHSNDYLATSSLDHDTNLEGIQDDLDVDVGGWLNPSPERQTQDLEGGEDETYHQGSGTNLAERDKQVEAILDLDLDLPAGDQASNLASSASGRSSMELDQLQVSYDSLDSHSLVNDQIQPSLRQDQASVGKEKKKGKKANRIANVDSNRTSVSLDLPELDQVNSNGRSRKSSSKSLKGGEGQDLHQQNQGEDSFQETENQITSWIGSEKRFQQQYAGIDHDDVNMDEPLYVNAKQYQRILARRLQREAKESQREEIWRKMWKKKIKEICDTQLQSTLSKDQNREQDDDEDEEEVVLEDLYDYETIEKGLQIAKDLGWENWSPHKPIGKDKSLKKKKGAIDGVVMEERIGEDGKPYLYESRHAHAMRRPRGKGGRFLTAQEIEELRLKEEAQGGHADAQGGPTMQRSDQDPPTTNHSNSLPGADAPN